MSRVSDLTMKARDALVNGSTGCMSTGEALASLFAITTTVSYASTVVGIDRNGKPIVECLLPEVAANSDFALKQLMRLQGAKSGVRVSGEVSFDVKTGTATFTASKAVMPDGTFGDWTIMPFYLSTELVHGAWRIVVGDHCAMTKPDSFGKE